MSSLFAKAPIVHVGSTKNLRQLRKPTAASPGVMWFEFTDDYSVFDHGKMPDSIPNKGASAAMLSAHLFEKIATPATWKDFVKRGVLDTIKDASLRSELADSAALKTLVRKGFPTHYQGIVDEHGKAVSLAKLKRPSRVLQVASVRILRPTPVSFGGRRLFNYGTIGLKDRNHLVPLECVFRFGVPTGSSLPGRLASIPGYAEELGLPARIREGSALPRPVIELFSKLEPGDRFLNYEFAMNAAGLSGEEFLTLIHATLLVALWLRERFGAIGLALWDGKFEFLRMTRGITLGDAITPDELRLTYKSFQISKEPLRQFHHKYQPRFIEGMKKAKALAVRVDRPLRQIVADLGASPKPLPEAMIRSISHMYAGITERMLGREIFGGTDSLDAVAAALRRLRVA